ncbi:MAG: ribbon-helix-helix protein, CopG family [Deinococcus sp.]|nr:ribbon-helix-helix protein, CopG family [Deinococcus sp.]
MKAISIHVPQEAYQELKSLAARTGRPVAELIRQAMVDYLERERSRNWSIADIPPHNSGALLLPWTRHELFEEMIER